MLAVQSAAIGAGGTGSTGSCSGRADAGVHTGRDARRQGDRDVSAGSGWLLVDGIVTLLLAVMIWSTWPSSAAWVVGTLIGISMLFSGITRLMLSVAVRRVLS